MWIFGYGSLMWDGWEIERGCSRRVVAVLPGFRRVFNKASVRNWGTRENPGPTLNLLADPKGSCVGICFEFPEEHRACVTAYLSEREGKAFPLRQRLVQIDEVETVTALVPLYEGKNLIAAANFDEVADMVSRARGSDGACINYVQGIAEKLEELNINDAAVEQLLTVLKRRGHLR